MTRSGRATVQSGPSSTHDAERRLSRTLHPNFTSVELRAMGERARQALTDFCEQQAWSRDDKNQWIRHLEAKLRKQNYALDDYKQGLKSDRSKIGDLRVKLRHAYNENDRLTAMASELRSENEQIRSEGFTVWADANNNIPHVQHRCSELEDALRRAYGTEPRCLYEQNMPRGSVSVVSRLTPLETERRVEHTRICIRPIHLDTKTIKGNLYSGVFIDYAKPPTLASQELGYRNG